MADTSLRTSAPALSFQSTTFSVVDRNGQRWLQAADIARALGYAEDDAISRLYRRREDEFTLEMSQTVNLTVSQNGGVLQRETRIFSLRGGAHLLAMFARTSVAKDFRRWVLDVLDKEVQMAAQAPVPAPVPSAAPVPVASPKQADAMRALIKATRKQFALVEQQFAQWEQENPVVVPEMRSLKATVEQAQRQADGSWALYVACGDIAMGVALGRGCVPRGGLKAGDRVRLEYAPGVNPLVGPFKRVRVLA